MSALMRANRIQCANILAESSTITFEEIKIFGNITFNSIPSENDVLTYTNSIWQAGPSVGGSTFVGNVDVGDTLNVGNICGPSINVSNSDLINVGSIRFNSSSGIIIGNSTTSSTGTDGIAIGAGAESSGDNAIAIGTESSALSGNSIALGYNITANQTNGFFVRHRGPGVYTNNPAGFIAGTNELVEVTSSRRFKENIRDLEEVSNVFELFRPVRYFAKPGHGDDREHIGLIAEEVEEIFPEFITYDQGGQVTGILFDRIVAVTIKEMKSMRSRREARKDKILSLKERITLLKTQS